MKRAQIVDVYTQKALYENQSLSQIRKELEVKDIAPEEINIIMRLIDSEVQRNAINLSDNKRNKGKTMAGAALLIAGLVLTLGTYTGFINFGRFYIVSVGPILGGLFMMLNGMEGFKKVRKR